MRGGAGVWLSSVSKTRPRALVGRVGANLVDVQHIREGLDLHIQETAIQLVLETRGPEHAAAVHAAIQAGGYEEATEIR